MLLDKREKHLIKKAKAGDEKSFEALISACQNKAYNIAYRYLRNEEDASDAIQESFIKIYRYLDNFKEDSKFETWVYRIVVNTCNDILRKNNRYKMVDSLYKTEEEGDFILEIPDSSKAPEVVLLQNEESNRILHSLEKLSSEHKEIIVLRDIQGFSYEEIGKILQCSIGTVKSRLSRSRLKLREVYMEQK